MSSLTLNVTNLEQLLKDEAGPVLMEFASRIIGSSTSMARPRGEGIAAQSIRGMLRANFHGRLQKALGDEEREVTALQAVLVKANGAGLDAVGGTMSVAREQGESDNDYRARLNAANDLETKPTWAAVRAAADTLVSTLLDNAGPVLDLADVSVGEMKDT